MKREVEVFDWILPPDIWRKKPHRSKSKMTREEALGRYPGAVVIPESREIKMLGSDPIPAGAPYSRR